MPVDRKADAEDDGQPGLCVAEYVAELVYGDGSKTLEQVASMTVYQTRYVYHRKRDKVGKLIRAGVAGVPEHVLNSTDSSGQRRVTKRVSLAEGYVRAKMKRHGLSKDQAVKQWEDYLRRLQEERAAKKASRNGRRARK